MSTHESEPNIVSHEADRDEADIPDHETDPGSPRHPNSRSWLGLSVDDDLFEPARWQSTIYGILHQFLFVIDAHVHDNIFWDWEAIERVLIAI